MKRAQNIAEQVTALAVSELVEQFFLHVPPQHRAVLMQQLRTPVLDAVWRFHMQTARKRRRNKRWYPQPSRN